MLSPEMVMGTFTGDDMCRLDDEDDADRVVENCGTGEKPTDEVAIENRSIREACMMFESIIIIG